MLKTRCAASVIHQQIWKECDPMIVGVIGGGQLARMMIPAAVNLGIEIRVLAEADGMAAELAASGVGDYRDLATVLAFAQTVDVITFDHEHVPQDVLRAQSGTGRPSSESFSRMSSLSWA